MAETRLIPLLPIVPPLHLLPLVLRHRSYDWSFSVVGLGEMACRKRRRSEPKSAHLDLNDGALWLAVSDLAEWIPAFAVDGLVDLIVGYGKARLPLFVSVPSRFNTAPLEVGGSTGWTQFSLRHCFDTIRPKLGAAFSCFNPFQPQSRVLGIVCVLPDLPCTATEDCVGLIVPVLNKAGIVQTRHADEAQEEDPKCIEVGADRTVFASSQSVRPAQVIAQPREPPPHHQYVVHYVNIRAPGQRAYGVTSLPTPAYSAHPLLTSLLYRVEHEPAPVISLPEEVDAGDIETRLDNYRDANPAIAQFSAQS